ncbi:MAG: hypothetical protein IJ584_03450 [Bacteroidales bacterium]|nr:hypothetical protein [Bacteroidales bacterium]
MPTIKLIPSTYYLSNSSYLSVSNASNMYTDTSSTTHATVTNSRTSTSSYYIYVRGFNFDDIPAGAIINSFTIRLKGNYSGGYSQVMYLYDGTSTSVGRSENSFSSTLTTHTFEPTSSWEEIVQMGSDFGIRINCRRSSRNQTSYIYIYGAEIEVDYTLPIYHNVSLTNYTSATAEVSGTSPLEGSEVNISIDTLDGIIVTDNGTDVTSQFVRGVGGTLSNTAVSQTHSGIQSGESYASYAVGNTAEDPYTSTSNMYASSSSTGHVDYAFDFSDIPSGATIQSVEVRVYGHRESSTTDSTHVANIQLMSGSTEKGTDQDFTSTSNQLITISDPGTWTRAELQEAVLRFTVGYYGGLVCGITWEVTYEVDGYVYTISNITTDHTIVVTYSQRTYINVNGVWVEAEMVYIKDNGAWKPAEKIHFKTNGTWKS